MQSISQVLQLTTRINTAVFQQGSSENDPENGTETSLVDVILKSANADFNKPCNTCTACGEFTQRDVNIQGVIRRLPRACKCRREYLQQQEAENERLKAKDIQRRLDKYKAYSLMDDRFLHSTFENWIERSDNKRLREFAWAYCENFDAVFAENKGILLYGDAGCGKTFAAFAIANELYKRGRSVMAISVHRILDIIKDSFNDFGENGETEIYETLGEASLLILDDLGVEYKTAWAYERLYNIIDTRYRAAKPLIITTNLRIKKDSKGRTVIDELRDNLAIIDIRTKQFDQSDRIYDRIVEMTAFQEVAGESWRVQKGAENENALYKMLKLQEVKK